MQRRWAHWTRALMRCSKTPRLRLSPIRSLRRPLTLHSRARRCHRKRRSPHGCRVALRADCSQAPKAQPKKQPVNKVTANKVTAQVEQLRHQVEMPEEVLIGLTNVLSGGRATECFNGVPTDLMSTDDSEGSFVNYIEAASAFGEGRTTEDRVAYMFSVFDVDGDGYLGEQDLRTVLGSDASEAEVQSLTAEIGGDPVHGVTVEALIQYVKLHPGVEDALVMKTRADGGVASQLAARPLVLLVLKQGSGSVAEFVKSLDRFGPQVPIKEKLARVFDTLDEDGNGQLTLSEVALVSKECTGEEVEALFDKLNEWINKNRTRNSSEQFVSRDDFLQFAVSSLPGVEEALTIRFAQKPLDLEKEYMRMQQS
eukprot:TRINITY_DN7298_c0_g1_i3.p1 TRINITY_DN7298_c0_g1~~TRINITY_DN7298_c0_g1_i3.p1  ORF type:complete len:368 (+),score=84.73 TRINITY_DN7298_c0_g1_i3:640-1743(+)